jgi:hypothetical protein
MVELNDARQWYFIKFGSQYALQYHGPDPDRDFPPGLEGTGIVSNLP